MIGIIGFVNPLIGILCSGDYSLAKNFRFEELILMLRKQDIGINPPSEYFQSRDLIPILKFIKVGIDPYFFKAKGVIMGINPLSHFFAKGD